MQTSTALAVLLTAALCLLAGGVLGFALGLLRPRRAEPGERAHRERVATALERRSGDDAVMREGLERLHDQMRDLEHQRVSWQGQLRQQVDDVRHATDTLRRETSTLSTALRRPQVRGRWGELHLRRTVELAGLVEHCDFAEQQAITGEPGSAGRPDLVVRLAGERQIAVDAKVPLDAYLDACETTEDDAREAHLARHAARLRAHVDTLASRGYWRGLGSGVELVVLFVPAESFLAAALEADRALLEHAAGRGVVLATPTTLIALLRTVAHGWSQHALTERADEVHRLGRELHERLRTMSAHLDKVGRSLNTAVGAYNSAMGSLDSRVLVSARRFRDLGVATGDDGGPATPQPVSLRAVERRVEPEQAPSARRLSP